MSSTLKDLQSAVTGLPEGAYAKFRSWFLERDWELWNDQIEADADSGKLDDLIGGALKDKEDGKLKDL